MTATEEDPRTAFEDALRAAGFDLRRHRVIADDKWHRCALVGGSVSNRSGAYVVTFDGVPRGYIQNHRQTELSGKWVHRQAFKRLSHDDLAAIRRKAAEAKASAAREEAERQERIAAKAVAEWDRAKPAAALNPYIQRKRISPTGLRVDWRGNLLVPMRDPAGRLRALQRIAGDGKKLFPKDLRTAGLHALLGQPEAGRPLLLAEGYATAATLHEATGLPVVAALNKPNFVSLARFYAKRGARPVFCGDDDRHLPQRDPPQPNAGRIAAEKAAQDLDTLALFPPFAEGEDGTDFNDFAVLHGNEAVRAVIEAALQPPAARTLLPTFPDRGIPLLDAQKRAAEVVRGFGSRIAAGAVLKLLLRVTVGGGKSQAAIDALLELLDAAHVGGREGALYYLVDRHDLGAELIARIQRAHPGLQVAVWRGMDRDDPERPGDKMCAAPELPGLAKAAGLSATAACASCPLAARCGYQRQRQQRADVWIAAHDLAFRALPAGLPKAALLVMDESFRSAGLAGMDRLHPAQLALSSLADERTGPLTGLARDRLLNLRKLVLAALTTMAAGGITRGAFEAVGLTAASADEWLQLEWQTQPKPDLRAGMERDDCGTAWNRNPVGGVIGVQTGPH